MKKVSMKMDKKALQAFLVEHFEKGILGLVVLVFLVLAYRAIARPVFDKHPAELSASAAAAEQTIANTPATVLDPFLKFDDYVTIAKHGWVFKEGAYDYATFTNPMVFPQRRKRLSPKLFPVEQLVGTADVAALGVRGGGEASAPDAAAPRRVGATRGFHFVMLTGLVPAAGQSAAYREAFKDNLRPTDKVEYVGYRIERTELDGRGGESAAEPIVSSIGKAKVEEFRNFWMSAGPEVAPPTTINEVLTCALPGRADRSWDERAVHVPEISIPTANKPRVAPGSEKPGPGVKSDDPFGVTAPAAPPAAGLEGAVAGPAVPSSEPGVEGAVAAAALRENVKYVLFRFIDTSVLPGKQYRYRVKLVLKNPNSDPEVLRLLADRALANDKWRETEWSEPTPVIGVPRDDRLLVLSVKPAPRAGAERLATILAVKWLDEPGAHVSKEIDSVGRGQLTYYAQQAVKSPGGPAESARPKDGGLLGAPEPASKPAKKGRSKDTPSGGETLVDFASNAVVLDMRGGERTGRDSRGPPQPGEVLLLDRDGTLLVRNEIDDVLERDVLQARPTPPGVERGGVPGAPAAGGNPREGGLLGR